MRPTPALLAPQAVTVALVGWLLWSLLGSPTPEPPPPKPLRIDAAQLSPRFGPIPPRDPFRTVAEVAIAASTPPPKPDAAPAPTPARPASTPPPVVAEARPTAVVGTADGSKELSVAVPTPPRLPDPREEWRALQASFKAWAKQSREFQATIAGRVRLSATMARGGTRRAILNDRTVAEGEAIRGVEGPDGSPVVVDQIRANAVVLRCRGTFAVVSFPSLARASAGASAGSKGPGGARP